jgi:hypothetical protein
MYGQGIAKLDCWIAQSGLQSNLVDWIVNPVLLLQSKSKISKYFIEKIKFHGA